MASYLLPLITTRRVMDDYDFEIREIETQIAAWKRRKHRPGTKIYYAEKRLSLLKEKGPPALRSKPSPRSSQIKKPGPPLRARPCAKNRAYVLSVEIYDLTQATVALERLR